MSGPRLTLRPAAPDDAPRFGDIVTMPGVAPWWFGYDETRVRAEIFGDASDEDSAWLAIEHAGEVIGLVIVSEENDLDYRHAAVDITLGDPWQDRGLGTEALVTLARYLFGERGHHRLTIDPAVANGRAIHVYEKVGFKPVGVMRQYERRPDGWRDGLLMDLLADEFFALWGSSTTP